MPQEFDNPHRHRDLELLAGPIKQDLHVRMTNACTPRTIMKPRLLCDTVQSSLHSAVVSGCRAEVYQAYGISQV